MYVFCVALAYAHRATTLGRPYGAYGSLRGYLRYAAHGTCHDTRLSKDHVDTTSKYS